MATAYKKLYISVAESLIYIDDFYSIDNNYNITVQDETGFRVVIILNLFTQCQDVKKYLEDAALIVIHPKNLKYVKDSKTWEYVQLYGNVIMSVSDIKRLCVSKEFDF